MIERVPIEKVTSPYGEERFNELDLIYITELELYYKTAPIVEFKAILVTKDYKIIDGHHRYLALKNIGKADILVCKLNCWFEDTEKLRDFQKHLKGMVPNDFDPKTLKNEFDEIILWLTQHTIN